MWGRTILTAVLIFATTGSCYPQSDSLKINDKQSSRINISFYGSVIYPGMKLGIEFPLYEVCVFKNGVLHAEKQRLVSVNVFFYHHPEFHDNLCFTSEWIMRRVRAGGFFTEFRTGIGYSRTFLGGTTYRVNDSGKVYIMKNAGYSYAVLNTAAGIGYNFSGSRKWPVSVYSDFGLITLFPYNSTLYFRPVINIGLIIKTGRFIMIMTKKRTIEK
jgi:hypothetical protein